MTPVSDSRHQAQHTTGCSGGCIRPFKAALVVMSAEDSPLPELTLRNVDVLLVFRREGSSAITLSHDVTRGTGFTTVISDLLVLLRVWRTVPKYLAPYNTT